MLIAHEIRWTMARHEEALPLFYDCSLATAGYPPLLFATFVSLERQSLVVPCEEAS